MICHFVDKNDFRWHCVVMHRYNILIEGVLTVYQMLSLMCSIWSFNKTCPHVVSIFILSKSQCTRCLFLNINSMKKDYKNDLLCFQIYIMLQATKHYFWNISFLLKKLIMVFLMLQFVVFKTWHVSQIWTLVLTIMNYKISN